ncbi:hypothetical protein [Evansella halocellulosilytica]|uniref:hypothetical protein n=1 Tax=Evansella halocellulosilytica TaxID=2011013 RepID=UPI000BB78C10|nr:hypothetical protein [Evansella halocellulosilytica]
MNNHSNVKKLFSDLFREQLKWTYWFLGVLFLAQIGINVILMNTGEIPMDFFTFSYESGKIYMLVIGVLSVYVFLYHLVANGITRKDYFLGAILSAAAISVAIMVITAIVSGLQYVVLDLMNVTFTLETSSQLKYDNWIFSYLVSMINLFAFFSIGWMIGAGYYRYGWLIGFAFVAIAILAVSFIDVSWEFNMNEWLSNWMPFLSEPPFFVSLLVSMIIILIMLWLVRALTKRVAIKM